MESQQSPMMQISDSITPKCRNHPTVSSRFFVVDQPEVRYCKNCALNMALCGRRIQKKLSREEHGRKLLVEAVVDQLRASMAEVQANQSYFEQLAALIELSSHPTFLKLEALEQFIKHLANLKIQLQTQYQGELQARMSAYHERTKQLTSYRQCIKQQLESIQSNFGNIIEENADDFEGLKTGWNEVVAATTKDLLTAEQFSFQRNKLGETIHTFEREFKEISRMRVLEAPLHELKQEENKENGQGEECPNVPTLRLVDELKLNLAANAHSKVRNPNRNTQRDSKTAAQKTDRRRQEVDGGRRPSHY